MKKWYCSNCKVFKRFKKTQIGFMGYPDTYHCRCCGAELINAKELIEEAKINFIKEEVKIKFIREEAEKELERSKK